jgi:7-cyano-7-deazaguanine tRNA-ribosyltransferase
VPNDVQVYLDNGSFYFLRREGQTSWDQYNEFVEKAKPDWYPIPRDYIPAPSMTPDEQWNFLHRTLHVNLAYRRDGYVPVIHASQTLADCLKLFRSDPDLMAKPVVAVGGLVPNLLRSSHARPYSEVLDGLTAVRQAFAGKQLHVFGVGGNSTLHLVELLGFDSADSSGWRNRAIRGLIQLPGTGDRAAVKLGNWRGRPPSEKEWERLRECQCPGCTANGAEGLTATGMRGFSTRAVHNLWVLLEEARLVEQHLADGSYATWYPEHLDNTIYRPLIDRLVSSVKEHRHCKAGVNAPVHSGSRSLQFPQVGAHSDRRGGG